MKPDADAAVSETVEPVGRLALHPVVYEISTFAATRAGLVLIDKVAFGGVRPVSVTERDHIVYVLNAGGIWRR